MESERKTGRQPGRARPGPKEPCHGVVIERHERGEVTFELKCEGDCGEHGGTCKPREETDHHGTKIEWCGCDDGERGCNIYLQTDARGRQSVRCFTLGCKTGWSCQKVEKASAEADGIKVIWWICACVKDKPLAPI